MSSAKFQADILDWYNKNQRVLPWREADGQAVAPYKVWLSEIMLQQTTVPAVIPYFLKFTEKWPDIIALANAKDEAVMAAWAGLGYYARARNLLKCARVIAHDFGGVFPPDRDALLALPGIGPYTAAAVAAIAFGQGETVIDGNIERIVARLYKIEEPLPLGKKEIRSKADQIFAGVEECGAPSVRKFPQALMDIGATICTPKSPKCGICPVQKYCHAYVSDGQEHYPLKLPKKIIPHRKGRVYWIENSKGQIILEKRDDNRMLGGMFGLPTTDWDKDKVFDESHSRHMPNRNMFHHIGNVHHVFSHFKLELEVWKGILPDKDFMVYSSPRYTVFDVAHHGLKEIGLPSVFLKAAKFVIGAR